MPKTTAKHTLESLLSIALSRREGGKTYFAKKLHIKVSDFKDKLNPENAAHFTDEEKNTIAVILVDIFSQHDFDSIRDRLPSDKEIIAMAPQIPEKQPAVKPTPPTTVVSEATPDVPEQSERPVLVGLAAYNEASRNGLYDRHLIKGRQ